ncbi:uncharacterized protein LOC119325846 isoform X1 [Triticum dicoccoides]|uniref:uncharacterized protein LOC119325846 isoform X1 n=1 Tax=Triticum dicoccoides TaxID=85692 RepID=UPI000E786BE3|nr:uncharacterized protein LOC119325846 isoform X1 [Triticum dicoccoides]XP_037455463.1 uncharacterized protein LOC119325846 isoform X1 [Triticum dicoccoides]
MCQGCFPWRNQANLQVGQQATPIYQDPSVAGLMNGPHVDYNNNPAPNSGRNILGANQVDQMAMQHEGQYLDPHVGLTNGLHADYTINLASNTEGLFMGGNQSNLPMEQYFEPVHPEPSVGGFMDGSHVYYTNNLSSNSGTNILGANQAEQMAVQHEGQYLACNISRFVNGSQPDCTTNPVPNSDSSGKHYHAETETQMTLPSNSYPLNDNMYCMTWETNMTNDNESSLEPFTPWEEFYTASAYDHTQDGH